MTMNTPKPNAVDKYFYKSLAYALHALKPIDRFLWQNKHSLTRAAVVGYVGCKTMNLVMGQPDGVEEDDNFSTLFSNHLLPNILGAGVGFLAGIAHADTEKKMNTTEQHDGLRAARVATEYLTTGACCLGPVIIAATQPVPDPDGMQVATKSFLFLTTAIAGDRLAEAAYRSVESHYRPRPQLD